VIQNHFFLGATFLGFEAALVDFLAAGFLAMGFLLAAALVAFLATLAGLAGDLAGDEVAATTGVVAAGAATTGLVAFLVAALAALGALGALVFGADFFDSDLFCALAIFYYYKYRWAKSLIYNPSKYYI
jgi:hypothetical protein